MFLYYVISWTGFSSKVVPQDLDAIVIGSGIGGLTAAAVLSKVLVLEQHDQAGGVATSSRRWGMSSIQVRIARYLYYT